jgi:hypothetical protein
MRTSIILATLFLLFFACQKTETLPGLPEPDKLINTNFTGKIFDENGDPVNNALITAGAKTTHTDLNGVFRINDVNISEQFGLVSAEKSGYFPGYRTVFSNADASNYIEIKLIPREIKSSFQSQSQATVSIANGVNVVFDKTAFVTNSGASYSGEVKVFGAYLDPSSENFENIMPGDLRGIDSKEQIVALVSYGMLAVELEGSDGQKLKVAPGGKATINLNIPSAFLASAPASIPLWYFDAETGKWKEEGSAKKINNAYTGEVSHFSYWNCDVPQNFVYASMELKDQHNNPLAYTSVKIINTSNGTFGYGKTDSTGYVKMWVPKDAPLEVNVINFCNEVLFTKNAGSYSQDANLGELEVNVNETIAVTISGTVVNCNSEPVQNGFVNALLDGLYYRSPVINGQFSLLINRCQNTDVQATIIASDIDAKKESLPAYFTVNKGNFEAGKLVACDTEIEEYIQFSIDGQNFTLTNPTDSIMLVRYNTSTFIYAHAKNQNRDPYLYISVHDTVPHTGKMEHASISRTGEYYQSNNKDFVDYTVTKFGKVNEFIEASFNGVLYKDTTSTTSFPFSGNFRLRRLN